MHGWPETTAFALPRIIARLRDEGATFVALDEWIGSPRTTVSTPNEGVSVIALLKERRPGP
jgi:hypothetical protein